MMELDIKIRSPLIIRPKPVKIQILSEKEKEERAHHNNNMKLQLLRSDSCPFIPIPDIYNAPERGTDDELRMVLSKTTPPMTRELVKKLCFHIAPRSKTGAKWFKIHKNPNNTKFLLRIWTQRASLVCLALARERLFGTDPTKLENLVEKWNSLWLEWEIEKFIEDNEKRWSRHEKQELAKLKDIGIDEKILMDLRSVTLLYDSEGKLENGGQTHGGSSKRQK